MISTSGGVATHQVQNRFQKREQSVSLPLWRFRIACIVSRLVWATQQKAKDARPPHELPVRRPSYLDVGFWEADL